MSQKPGNLRANRFEISSNVKIKTRFSIVIRSKYAAVQPKTGIGRNGNYWGSRCYREVKNLYFYSILKNKTLKSHHLSVLGLDEHASEEEIKTAYRRLSKKYHPDVNRSPDAEKQFIRIKEAYEFLTAQEGESQTHFSWTEEEEEYEDWKRAYHQKAREEAKAKEQSQQALIQKLMTYLKPMTLAVLIFNVLLVIDFFLPLRDVEQHVLSVRQITYSNRDGQGGYFTENYYEVRFSDYVMEFNRQQLNWKDPGARATVQITRIFSKPIYGVFNTGEDSIRLRQVYNIYYSFGFIIPIILAMCIVFLFIRKPATQFNLSVMILLVLVIQLYLFFR